MQTQPTPTEPPSRSMSYRADIDGLRAIAVLSVVIYHAMPEYLTGGFVGVDVFFVISGYLITGILVADTQGGNFSLSRFYERRIRRIVPALVAVVLATLFVGYFLLHPGDYRDLGDSAVWTIGFLANAFFWLHTGYFDASRETMPLLHMWSLAVEEQFYLAWPLIVFLLVRWLAKQPRLPWFALSAFFLASFLACVKFSETDPQAAFYLPATRAWELGIGAMLAFLSADTLRTRAAAVLAKALPWVGIGLIAYGMTQLTSEMPFPSYNALYPVLGSACLIFAGGVTTSLVGRLLAIKPMVFFGKISYSLYLWHWPVFVYFRHYTNGSHFTVTEAVALILVSIILATLSWRFIEQPLRYTKMSRGRVFAGGITACIFAAALGGLIVANNGVPSRIPDAARQLADHKTMWSWECPSKYKFDKISRRRCVLGETWETAGKHAVLWGDSHALHYAPLIDRIARRQGYSVFLFDSCPPYLDNQLIQRHRTNQPAYSEECGLEYSEIMEFFAADTKVDLVILASAWAMYPKDLQAPDGNRSEETGLVLMHQGISRLAASFNTDGRQVLAITEVPRPGTNLIPCVLSSVSGVLRRPCESDPSRLSVADIQKTHGSTNAVLHSLADDFANLQIIDATARMCGEQWCETFVNGEFIYRDTNHLRRNLKLETMDQLIRTIGIETAIKTESATESATETATAPTL